MMSLLNKSKGVVLLFIALVCMSNLITARVNELNKMEQANSIAYYEK